MLKSESQWQEYFAFSSYGLVTILQCNAFNYVRLVYRADDRCIWSVNVSLGFQCRRGTITDNSNLLASKGSFVRPLLATHAAHTNSFYMKVTSTE